MFSPDVQPVVVMITHSTHCVCRSSTASEFKSAQEMLEAWMVDQTTLRLSDYGTRKFFDALKRIMWVKTSKSLSGLQYLKDSEAGPDKLQCERCSKFHKGGADSCKSKDRVSLTMFVR